MPKSRQSKVESSGGKPVRWSIYRFGKKVAWLGHVEAASESEAIDKGCELFKVAEADRFRIAARAEE